MPEEKRVSLWRAAFAASARLARAQGQWVALYIGLIVLGNILVVAGTHITAAKVVTHSPQAFLGYALQWLVMLVGGYGLYVLFLRAEAPEKTPVASVGNFFYWFGQSLLMGLAMIVPLLVTAVPVVVWHAIYANMESAAHVQATPPAIFGLLAVAAIFAGILFFAFLMIRLMLVPSLAVLRRKPVWRTCWRLTKGQFWRIFGNFLLLYLFIFIVMLVATLAAVAATLPFLGKEASLPIVGVVIALVSGGMSVIFTGFFTATCAVRLRETGQGAPPPVAS